MSELALIDARGLQRKSGIGLPHSKTWRKYCDRKRRASVLECGSPMPLSDRPRRATRTGQKARPTTYSLFTHYVPWLSIDLKRR
jgi:hypothetical protein